VTKVLRHILPFFAAMVMVLIITMYFPAISLWLPEKLGLLK
jgi:TRAP-type C4-dicarboxylate transport system permease large subunit